MCHFRCCCLFLNKAEKVSLHGFINMLLVISCALVWAVLPSDFLAFGADFLQSMILAVSIPLVVMVIQVFVILIEIIIIINKYLQYEKREESAHDRHGQTAKRQKNNSTLIGPL